MIGQDFIWSGTEFINDMMGTRDLAAILTGFVANLLGAVLSLWVNIPFGNLNLSKWKKFIIGMICTTAFMRGFAPSFTDVTRLWLFAFGCGLLNYHLYQIIIQFAIQQVSKLVPNSTIMQNFQTTLIAKPPANPPAK